MNGSWDGSRWMCFDRWPLAIFGNEGLARAMLGFFEEANLPRVDTSQRYVRFGEKAREPKERCGGIHCQGSTERSSIAARPVSNKLLLGLRR